MHHVARISTTLVLGVALSAAATCSADAKKGGHGKHHGHGHVYAQYHHGHGPAFVYYEPSHAYVRPVAAPNYSYAASPVPLYTAPALAGIPHTEWCTQTYQTYDSASDTFLRFDGVRVPCVGP